MCPGMRISWRFLDANVAARWMVSSTSQQSLWTLSLVDRKSSFTWWPLMLPETSFNLVSHWRSSGHNYIALIPVASPPPKDSITCCSLRLDIDNGLSQNPLPYSSLALVQSYLKDVAAKTCNPYLSIVFIIIYLSLYDITPTCLYICIFI